MLQSFIWPACVPSSKSLVYTAQTKCNVKASSVLWPDRLAVATAFLSKKIMKTTGIKHLLVSGYLMSSDKMLTSSLTAKDNKLVIQITDKLTYNEILIILMQVANCICILTYMFTCVISYGRSDWLPLQHIILLCSNCPLSTFRCCVFLQNFWSHCK
jgi:hypothetical protein